MKGVTYRIIGADGREYGPIGLNDIRDWIDDQRVGQDTRVWSSEDERWLAALSRPELKWNFETQLAESPPVLAAEIQPTTAFSQGLPVDPMLTHRASLPLRLAAVGCDYVLFTLGLTLLTSPWSAQISEMNKAAYESFGSPNPDPKLIWDMLRYLGTAVVPASYLYYAALPMVLGSTPGKFIARLTVVQVDGSPVTWLRSTVRWAASLGCVLTFGFGFLPMLFTPLRQGLQDLIAGTVVVRRWED